MTWFWHMWLTLLGLMQEARDISFDLKRALESNCSLWPPCERKSAGRKEESACCKNKAQSSAITFLTRLRHGIGVLFKLLSDPKGSLQQSVFLKILWLDFSLLHPHIKLDLGSSWRRLIVMSVKVIWTCMIFIPTSHTSHLIEHNLVLFQCFSFWLIISLWLFEHKMD